MTLVPSCHCVLIWHSHKLIALFDCFLLAQTEQIKVPLGGGAKQYGDAYIYYTSKGKIVIFSWLELEINQLI